MANNGVSFWGILFNIIDAFKRSSEKKKFRREVDNENEVNRRVAQFSPAPIEAYASRFPLANTIISGNNDELRARLVCAAAYNAQRNNRPVIVLHDGNDSLIERMNEAFSGNENFYSINDGNKIYNPFAGRNDREISNFILSAVGENNSRLQASSFNFLEAVTMYLETRQIPLTLSSYIDCISNREYDFASELAEMGDFPEQEALLISNKIRESRDCVGAVEAYFSRLETELYTVLAPASSDDGISIKSAINERGVIMIDVSSNNSNMLNIVMQEIKDLISKGQALSIMMESVSLDENESLARELRRLSSKCNFVYSAQDVHASAQGNTGLLTTMLGRSNVYVLQHSSGISSEEFSKFFGEYYKYETSHNYHEGTGLSGFDSNPSTNHGRGMSAQREKRRRVEEDDIIGLGRNQAFIKLMNTTDVISTTFRDGSCLVEYDQPTRIERPARNSGPVNWLAFVLLTLLSPIFGLIYLMVKSPSRRVKIICGSIMGALLLLSIIVSIVSG